MVRHEAYIGMGSNLGDRWQYLSQALCAMGSLGVVARYSKVYETEPVGGPEGQFPYLNMVAALLTDLPAEPLLDELLAIEAAHGRVRTVKNGPRTIDLDLLLWDDAILDSARLTLPHPRMSQRRFVLEPLLDVHPNPSSIPSMDWQDAWDRVQAQSVWCCGPMVVAREQSS